MVRKQYKKGKVVGVNGNMVSVRYETTVIQNEVAYVLTGNCRLKGEVIRVRGEEADLQIFEDTRDIKIGDGVEFSGELLSLQLGPGLLTKVFDGLQNPLPKLAEQAGFFLQRGLYLDPLDREQQWAFTPQVQVGAVVSAGDAVGTVPEGLFQHRIMVPFAWPGTWQVVWIAPTSYLTVDNVVARLSNGREERQMTMVQSWPVKIPIDAYRKKHLPVDPLVTQIRVIDTFFPVAKGGTFCVPGPFGAGKTVLQHSLSRYSEVDVVIMAACGERAGEVVEVLTEFPELEDPRTGRSLMDRTIIICNTSSMPVAARETSIYTSVTLAEYYRQMGLHVLLLADSTSRWAQALREMSGRLEEIPGEEAFPAYLETRIAGFYERAGLVELNDASFGSITIGGAVSPAGGNFEEPVTQGTLKVVGGFLGLSRDRANARRYPAINPLDSWSKYHPVVPSQKVRRARTVLQQGNDINQMMKVVGEEGTPVEDFTLFLKSEFLDSVYLQQNSFDAIDAACSAERQNYLFEKVLGVIEGQFDLASHGEARSFFQNLRQLFIDWHYTPWDSGEFRAAESRIDELLAAKRRS
ncbi:V-type ATP synthase subunit A [Desulfuromonas sp. CSMB_57]|jgi:V/A-type H+-transporting ATPase subunit A|uniref:V-type ATP synthase subunit A n=1 Tax=Desulfuromonas sp. CSMB_57 TaxID=2807629 RepID=UPI001CD1BE00|nr:V-type ATP synthase subunit A [Desulfuromonas sp. CSMB_57]